MKSLNKWLSIFIKWVTAGFLVQTGAGEESSCCCLEESTFCGRAVLNKHLVLGRGDVEGQWPPSQRAHSTQSWENIRYFKGKGIWGLIFAIQSEGKQEEDILLHWQVWCTRGRMRCKCVGLAEVRVHHGNLFIFLNFFLKFWLKFLIKF